MLFNTPNSYGLVSRANHWMTAILFIGLIALGIYMHELEDSDFKYQLYDLHKALGIGVLFLVVLRVIWNNINSRPESISHNKLEENLAKWVKRIFYFALFAMPISGWFMSNSAGYDVSFFGLLTMPNFIGENETVLDITKAIHGTLGPLMIMVIALHFIGAMKHHFIYKDSTLLRMLGKDSKADKPEKE